MTSKNYSTDVITAFKSVDNANKIIGYDADANAITKKAKATIYNLRFARIVNGLPN